MPTVVVAPTSTSGEPVTHATFSMHGLSSPTRRTTTGGPKDTTATYGNSGVMTFLVNHDGVVYEKDLGPSTTTAVTQISSFDPDKSWTPAQ
jgi:hypothetical protein